MAFSCMTLTIILMQLSKKKNLILNDSANVCTRQQQSSHTYGEMVVMVNKMWLMTDLLQVYCGTVNKVANINSYSEWCNMSCTVNLKVRRNFATVGWLFKRVFL